MCEGARGWGVASIAHFMNGHDEAQLNSILRCIPRNSVYSKECMFLELLGSKYRIVFLYASAYKLAGYNQPGFKVC